jgi:chemotaxis protein CheX
MGKILIVEPDREFRTEAVNLFKKAGYKDVFSAPNGEQALAICQKERPELIILNMSLPDYFGLELPALIAADNKNYGTPQFMVLWDSFFANQSPSDLEKKYRITKVIQKPCKPEDLPGPAKNIVSVIDSSYLDFGDFPVEYIQIFIDSAINFLKTMTDIPIRIGKVYFKNDPFAHADITAKMDVSGIMEGSVCLSFEKQIAVFLVSRMVGEDIKEFDSSVKDGIGEAVNIIVGSCKNFFSEKKLNYKIGLPKILTGKQMIHKLAPRVPCTVIPLITGNGTFFIETCVQISEKPN